MEVENPMNAFVGRRDIKMVTELTEELNKKLFIGTDTGVAYRALSHWENEGLYDNNREENQRWRRFSFVEFVWIRMIDQMRNIGLKIDVIRMVREEILAPTPLIELWTLMWSLGDMGKVVNNQLTEEDQEDYQAFFSKLLADPPEGSEQMQVTLLQLLIANVIAKRCPIILIVFPDGDFFWIEEHPEFVTPPEFLDRLSYEPHVRISITGIIKEFWAGELAFERIDSLNLLDPNETYLLRAVHSGEYDSITINFRNQKMDALELVKSQTTTKKIVDILAEGDYQDINIVQHRGRVTRIENTLKYRFSEK